MLFTSDISLKEIDLQEDCVPVHFHSAYLCDYSLPLFSHRGKSISAFMEIKCFVHSQFSSHGPWFSFPSHGAWKVHRAWNMYGVWKSIKHQKSMEHNSLMETDWLTFTTNGNRLKQTPKGWEWPYRFYFCPWNMSNWHGAYCILHNPVPPSSYTSLSLTRTFNKKTLCVRDWVEPVPHLNWDEKVQ